MDDVKHTPAPWIIQRDFRYGMIVKEDGNPIVDTLLSSPADRQLIWAAPDMLLALRTAERELSAAQDGSVGGVPNSAALLIPEALEQVRAAISKATGVA